MEDEFGDGWNSISEECDCTDCNGTRSTGRCFRSEVGAPIARYCIFFFYHSPFPLLYSFHSLVVGNWLLHNHEWPNRLPFYASIQPLPYFQYNPSTTISIPIYVSSWCTFFFITFSEEKKYIKKMYRSVHRRKIVHAPVYIYVSLPRDADVQAGVDA